MYFTIPIEASYFSNQIFIWDNIDRVPLSGLTVCGMVSSLFQFH